MFVAPDLLVFATQGPPGLPGLEGPKVRELFVGDTYSITVPFCGQK